MDYLNCTVLPLDITGSKTVSYPLSPWSNYILLFVLSSFAGLDEKKNSICQSHIRATVLYMLSAWDNI